MNYTGVDFIMHFKPLLSRIDRPFSFIINMDGVETSLIKSKLLMLMQKNLIKIYNRLDILWENIEGKLVQL